MKKLGIIFSLILFFFSVQGQQKETYHFKFIEPNKAIVNSTITHLISIDKVNHDTIYAYANADEMRVFEKLGYKYTLIPEPSFNTKSISMATTVDQMVNWDKYPTYSVYRAMMKKFENDYPALCKLDSIGATNNGHKIYVVKLSKNVAIEEPEVEVFYTSTMHGNETTGFILMLKLIDSLLTSYSTDTHIASMLNSMAIYINPNANPDGTYIPSDNDISSADRRNAAGFDLNRNFPDPRLGYFTTIQPETQIMMNFASSRHLTLSVNFHDGVELVNYPWDTWVSSSKTHPDNNWFIHVSRQYADSAQANSPLGYFTDENNGITEGGDWYIVTGGRQDYMNWWQHCKEVCIELSGYQPLPSELLQNLWNYNKAALITYLESATKGFNGIVTNTLGSPLKAKIFITGHDADSSHVYSSSTTGFYARPIEPGTWQVTYSSPGYVSQTHTINIADWNSSVEKNVELVPKFSVEFDVKEATTPLEYVNINFNGIDKQTISNGSATFTDVPQSDGYSYLISLIGYHTATGHVNIIDNRTITVNLIPETTTVYTVSFEVLSQTAPVENAAISFNSIEQESSSSGIVPFTNTIQGNNLNYSISKPGYQTVTGQIDVAENKTISIDLVPYTYSLSFNIKHLGAGISNATINFNGIDLQTAPDGSAIFNNLLYGKGYSYSINKSGYKTVTGDIDITSDKIIDVEFIPLLTVSFSVKNQGTPIVNANVLFNSLVLPTASDGTTTFNDVLYGNGYRYTISLTNYYKVQGQVDVVENKNINIELTHVGISSPVEVKNLLSVWPNPFSSDINISFILDSPTFINLSVYSIDGRLVNILANGLYPEGLNTLNSTNLVGINNGSYVVVLRVGNKSYSQIIQHIR